jgi:hypothetical protein
MEGLNSAKAWARLREQQPELDENEAWAVIRLSPLIGPMRLVDMSGRQHKHDFEATLPDGRFAAIEVTSETNRVLLSTRAAIQQKDLDRVHIEGDVSWIFSIEHDARVSQLQPQLVGLANRLVAAGRTEWSNLEFHSPDPIDADLRKLHVSRVQSLYTPGDSFISVWTAAFGGWGWMGEAVDAWLTEFLTGQIGLKELEKLAASGADQKHLVVVLNVATEAGTGIPLGLIARRERGVEDYVMPAIRPPGTVTHLWLLPRSETQEGLAWSCDVGWVILPAFVTT